MATPSTLAGRNSVGSGGRIDGGRDPGEVAEMHQLLQHAKVHLATAPSPEAFAQLGFVLQAVDVRQHSGGQLQTEALDAFEAAVRLGLPTELETRVQHHMGMLLAMMGRAQQAVDAHAVCLALDPPSDLAANAWFEMGQALLLLRRAEEAVEAFREALHRNPSHTVAFAGLVEAQVALDGQDTSTDDWQALRREMSRALTKAPPDLLPAHKSALLHALFRASNRLRQPKQAWRYLQAYHRIESARRPAYKPELAAFRVQQTMDVFQAGFWPTPQMGDPTLVPIFVIGSMRSGSTLVEQMLHTHSNILGIGEDSVFNGMLGEIRDGIVAAMGAQTRSKSQSQSQELQRVILRYSSRVVDSMVEKAQTMHHGARAGHLVDKMLFNFRNVGFIHLLFPRALIVHMVRDPMDTLWSCLSSKFDDIGLEWTLSVEHLVGEYLAYLRLMAHWRTVLPGRVLDVQYESLVEEPEECLSKMLAHVGERWEPDMLQFHRQSRDVHTLSMSQVRQPLYTSAVGKWVPYAHQLDPMIHLLWPTLERMLAAGHLPFPDTVNWGLDTDWYGDHIEQRPSSSDHATQTTVSSRADPATDWAATAATDDPSSNPDGGAAARDSSRASSASEWNACGASC